MSEKMLKLDAWKKHREELGMSASAGPSAHAAAESPVTDRVRQWWEIASIADFRQAIELMTLDELQLLAIDLKAAKAGCGLTVSDKQADPDKRRRARSALGYYIEKWRIVSGLITVKAKAERAQDPESYQSLKERCILLAAEVARLQGTTTSDTRIAVALEFLEVCRVAMAESAFNRYLERARDRVHGSSKKGPGQ